MADYTLPKINTAYVFYTALVSQADTKLLKSSPTIASGDFKVSIDGGAFANLATLPTNTPSGTAVKISLSAAEMNGSSIFVTCIDAAGAEWCDQAINIQTSARGIEDLATPTNITAGTIATVTTLTNLPAITANWLTAAGLATDAVTEITAAITAAGGLSTAQAAQLSQILTTVTAAPIVTSSTATNIVDNEPLSINIGDEYSTSNPHGQFTLSVSNAYVVSGWTATLKIFAKSSTASSALMSVAGGWLDETLSTQRIAFTLQETDTDNITDVTVPYLWQVEFLCGAGKPYTTQSGPVKIGSVRSV